MTSPMRTPDAFDRFTLLASAGRGGARLTLPGVPTVKVKRGVREDELEAAGTSGKTVANFGDSTAVLTVTFVFTTHEEYRAFVPIIRQLRIKSGDEPRVYDAIHPTVQAHGIRKVRHTDTQDDGYSPREGYRVQLTFSEYYKPKSGAVARLEGDEQYDAALGVTPGAAGSGASTATTPLGGPKGQAILAAAAIGLTTNTARVDRCSVYARESFQRAFPGEGRALFGASALETSALFRKAGLSRPFDQVQYAGLKPGDLIFYDADRSGYGHVGVYQGNGMVIGNDTLSYRQRGGLFRNGIATGFDKDGKPVDARGVQRIDALGKPTSVGRLDGFTGTPKAVPVFGPPAPPVITPPALPRKD